MKTPVQSIHSIDYTQEHASDAIVPRPAALKSSGWNEIHFELHQQPTFATAEHIHTAHVLASGVGYSAKGYAPGIRWLDGKPERERRNLGDVAIIPAGIAHRCSWDTPTQFMVLAIEPVLLQQMGKDWVNPDQIELMPRFMSDQDQFIQTIFSTLKTEVEAGGMGSHLLVDSLKTALAIHLLRHYCSTQPKLSSYVNGLSQSKLTLVTDYIHTHLHQELKLENIAAIAQISPYHFLRLFKQRLGITPHQYILQCRIERAKYLLQHSKLNIADIAIQSGFCDQSHLNRYFKRIVGVTPKQLQA
ncbi:MAG TPA: AraC family transcriptional regulator, partial [Allocoleopsis sp.]